MKYRPTLRRLTPALLGAAAALLASCTSVNTLPPDAPRAAVAPAPRVEGPVAQSVAPAGDKLTGPAR